MEEKSLFKEYEGAFKTDNPEENSDSKVKKGNFFGYSPFALQDAIGERSAKKAWIEYEKLRFAGTEAEELIHNIVSKVRDMTAISIGAKREDLNMKDYPFNKSKRDLKKLESAGIKKFLHQSCRNLSPVQDGRRRIGYIGRKYSIEYLIKIY